MHLEQTLHQMRSMRLSYMAQSLEQRLKNGDNRDLCHEEFVALLVEDEYNSRRNRRLTLMLSRSNFKANPACIEDIKYSSERGIGKADITPFTGEGWIKQKQNLILTGSTGTGKTYLAEAIGRRALGMGYQTVKIRYNRLFDEIHTARGTGVYSKYLEKIGKIQVLILDDFANGEISAKDMSDLVEIIEDMDGKAPIIITSQYPVSKWHQRFPDPTLADALCDRLIHGATKINLKGESMRKNREKST